MLVARSGSSMTSQMSRTPVTVGVDLGVAAADVGLGSRPHGLRFGLAHFFIFLKLIFSVSPLKLLA
jgi:hypothetical protein